MAFRYYGAILQIALAARWERTCWALIIGVCSTELCFFVDLKAITIADLDIPYRERSLRKWLPAYSTLYYTEFKACGVSIPISSFRPAVSDESLI